MPLPPADPTATPRDLPRLVMRRAGLLALAVLVLAVGLGLLRAQQDIDDELTGAQALARVLATLAQLGAEPDDVALARLAALREQPPLRHLALQVRDAAGREVLALPSPTPGDASPAHAEQWPLARSQGGAWQVRLTVSAQAERHEALTNLAGMLALLLLCVAALLLAMRVNLARAFAPLQSLLGAIAGVERDDAAPLRALPAMPIGELEAIAAALRHLAQSLEEAQARRRRLAQQVLTLQEDERTRLARELHDELGQRLTAMRVDAAWLRKRLPEDDERRAVVDGVAAQCEQIQLDLRQMLARLRPLGASDDEAAAVEPVSRLTELLRALVDGWNSGGGRETRVQLRLDLGTGERLLPRPLVLAVYRLSQEALTNVARHAQARMATLSLSIDGQVLDWSVIDDGIGLTTTTGATASALQRGNGLAGMQERVWALGSELRLAPAWPTDPARPGLALSARFPL